MINRELKELLEVLDEIKKEMLKEEKKYPFSGWEKSRKKVKGETEEISRVHRYNRTSRRIRK